MSRWMIPMAGIALAAAAVGGGVAVWATSDDHGAGCDRAALSQAITDGMHRADVDGANQFMPDATAGCRDDEKFAVMQELTREWHMMPGGMMMRSTDHLDR